jgi:hypothetical protein
MSMSPLPSQKSEASISCPLRNRKSHYLALFKGAGRLCFRDARAGTETRPYVGFHVVLLVSPTLPSCGLVGFAVGAGLRARPNIASSPFTALTTEWHIGGCFQPNGAEAWVTHFVNNQRRSQTVLALTLSRSLVQSCALWESRDSISCGGRQACRIWQGRRSRP